MRFIQSLIFVLLFNIYIPLFAQTNSDIIYSNTEMISDFNYLHKHLLLNHPGVFRYTNKQTWDSIYQQTLLKLTKPLKDVQYRLILRNYLSYVKCGHTQVIPSHKSLKTYNKKKHSSVPFKVAFINNKIIVSENESNDSNLTKGTEILAINNHLAINIIQNINTIQNADAGLTSMKNYYGASQFQTYFNAFYGEDSIFKIISINLKGDTQTHVLKQKTKAKTTIKALKEKTTLLNQKYAKFTLCKGDTQTAILKIKGFQLKNASKFYARIFDKLQENNTKYLVIDLRGNGGGNIIDAAELISYLSKDTFSYSFARGTQGLTYNKHAKQKFIYYFSRTMLTLFGNKTLFNNQYHYYFNYDKKSLKGNNHFNGAIFCIIDNGAFSAASFVAAYMKHKANAVVIGQETAGTESGCYAVNTPLLELPLTKNFIRIPHYQFKHHLPIVDSERGVLPFIETPLNSITINDEKDVEMNLIWKLIFDNQKE